MEICSWSPGMVAYVDTAFRRSHVVFDPSSGELFRARSLIELRDLGYEEVYVDSLNNRILPEILELLRSGVRCYYLKRLSLLEEVRKSNNLIKNDENDARALSKIPKEMFRELMKNRVNLRSLLSRYYFYADLKRKLSQARKSVNDEEFRELIRYVDRLRTKLKRVIVKSALGTLTEYSLLKMKLGLAGVSLVTLLIYIDDWKIGWKKLKSFAGLHEGAKKSKRFSRKVKRALWALATMAIKYDNPRYKPIHEYYLKKLGRWRRAKLRVMEWILRDIRDTIHGRPLKETPTQ